MKRLMLAVLPALALAACGKSDNGGANGQAAAADDGKPKTVEQVAAEMRSAPKMRPGEWETTVQVVKFDMPDAPPQMKQAMEKSMAEGKSSKSCVTPEEAQRDPAEFLKKGQGENCTYERFSFAGGKIDGKMSCATPQQGKMEATMTGTIGTDAISMTMDNVMSGGPMPGKMAMTMKMESKRIGDCK